MQHYMEVNDANMTLSTEIQFNSDRQTTSSKFFACVISMSLFRTLAAMKIAA